MKNLIRSFVCLSVCISFSTQTQCQEVEAKTICGSDTIKITLDNFQFGTIGWQESMDGTNWVEIKDEHDTVLIYYTTEEKYIRGCCITSECEKVYSDPAFIRQPPVAYAGEDKDIMTNKIYLKGNLKDGATGTWHIQEGYKGKILQEDNAFTGFEFEIDTSNSSSKDSTYLIWTLENQCGSSTDTMKVSFFRNSYNPNRILIDSTDSLLISESDTVKGIYCIQFSDLSEITLSDSAILIAYTGNGFLRKVDSFNLINDSTVKFFTEAAAIEDLFLDGVLSLGDDVLPPDYDTKSGADPHILSYLPTRNELQTDPKFRDGVYVYHYPDTYETSSLVKSVNANSKGLGFSLDNSVRIEDGEDFLDIGLKGNIDFDPNFVFSYSIKRKWLNIYLNYLKVGMENASLTNNIELNMEAEFSRDTTYEKKKEMSEGKKKEIAKKTSRKVVIAGTVPILVVNNLSCTFSVKPHIEADLKAHYTWGRSSTFSAYMVYRRGRSLESVLKKGDSYTYTDYGVEFHGSTGVDFTLETSVDMLIYGIIGPYLSVPITLKPEVCGSFRAMGTDTLQNQAKNQDTLQFTYGFNVPLSIDANVGCKVKLFRKVLFNKSTSLNIYKTGFYYPYSVDMLSGNQQSALPGNTLINPFKVRLKNNWGGGAPYIPVYFSVVEGNGILDNPWVFSGPGGYAENNLTLGPDIGTDNYNRIKVQAFNCDFEPLKGAEDLYFEVNSKCQNSSLQLSFNFLEDRTVQPIGIMGTKPYSYSINGTDYFKDITYPLDSVLGKTVYVMDADTCTASKMLTVLDTCAYSDLSVSVYLNATHAVAEGFSGIPPYTYALDSIMPYSEQNEFRYLNPGSHVMYIKDSAGCTSSTEFFVYIESDDGLVAYYPFNGNATDVTGNLHNGEVNGATLVPDRFGRKNSAYAFDSTDIIRVPADDGFIMDGDFSISMWSYTDLTGGNFTQSDHFPFSFGKDVIDTTGLHLAFIPSDGFVYYWLYSSEKYSFPIFENYPGIFSYQNEEDTEGSWHHLAIIRKSDSIEFYTDEILVGKFYEPGELFRSCDIHFGNTFDNNHPLNGRLDDIRIYNRALLPAEINELFHEN